MAAPLVDNLTDFSAFVAGVGQGGGPYLGIALMIVVNEGQDAAAVEAYARRVLEGEGRLGDPPRKHARATASREGQRTSDALLGWVLILAVILLGVLLVWGWR